MHSWNGNLDLLQSEFPYALSLSYSQNKINYDTSIQ